MSEMKEMQPLAVVDIDENNLDKECIKLPSAYLRHAHRSAEAKRDVDEVKRQLDVVEADMAKKVRDNPGAYGLEKVTESAVAATVLRSGTYQAALQTLNEAKYKAELAQAVVWALEHKKRTLTLLVELHGMGYFSNPKVSERGREAVDDMSKRRTRRLDRD